MPASEESGRETTHYRAQRIRNVMSLDHDTPDDFPIEREPDRVPDAHVTYAAGVSRAGINGARFQELRRENMRRAQAAKHARQSHTA